MSINIRYPNITGATDKEQLSQVKSYLHQLVDQLNYALPTIGTGGGSSDGSSTYDVQGVEMSYYELRSLVMQEIQEVEKLLDNLEAYVTVGELTEALETALTQAKESGEFDGPQGDPGDDGDDGFSPTVEVEQIEGGHRVTITDAISAKSFDVMDGKDGEDGNGAAGGLFVTDDGYGNVVVSSSTISIVDDGYGNVTIT